MQTLPSSSVQTRERAQPTQDATSKRQRIPAEPLHQEPTHERTDERARRIRNRHEREGLRVCTLGAKGARGLLVGDDIHGLREGRGGEHVQRDADEQQERAQERELGWGVVVDEAEEDD